MRPLILLGASVRAAACSARRAGYAPFGIDLFADRDLAALGPAVKIQRYPGDFLAALQTAPPAQWMYGGGLENHPRLVDRLAAIRSLAGNPGSVLRRVRDPAQLMIAAHEAGCDFPESIFHNAEMQAAGKKWLIKPRRSSGGKGIRLATPAGTIRLARDSYLQAHTGGEAASAVFVSAGGQAALIGGTRQILGSDEGLTLPFLYVGSVGLLQFGAAEWDRLNALGGILAERFGLVGLFNIDFVRRGDQLWILEVNPRYSASMEVVERVLDVNLIDWHLRACEAGELPSAIRAVVPRHAGKMVVYARRSGVVPQALDDVAREWNGDSQWPGLADLPRIGESFQAGQPVVTVLADGDSSRSVAERLQHRAAEIERLLADS